MKTLMSLLLVLFSLSSFAESLVIEATIYPWISHCQKPRECNVPVASHAPIKMKLFIAELYEPQTGGMFEKEFNLEGERAGSLKAFSVYPKEDSNLPPYIQFQFTQSFPTYLLCSHSIKLRRPMSVPPLICASSHGEKNIGYTITFKQVHN